MPQLLLRACVVTSLLLAQVGFACAFTFHSSEGHFTAELPEEPKFSKSNGMTNDKTPTTLYRWEVDKGETYYSITVAVSNRNVVFNYDNGTRGLVAAAKGNLVDQRPFHLQGMTGREVVVATKDIVIRVRMIMVGQRLYQIEYACRPGSEKSAEADAFLNSLRLDK